MPRRLANVHQAFWDELAEALDFFNRGFAGIDRTTGRHVFTNQQKLVLAEATFLLCCVAWERFLEYSFACYITGERARSGYRTRRIRRMDMSVAEARRIVLGDNKFVGWVDAKIVGSRAKKWFEDGEPFSTALAGGSNLLNYLQLMRNVIAHDSGSAFESFKNATRISFGSVPAGLSAGGQLVTPCPASLGGVGANLLDTAVAYYRLMSDQIVP